MACLAVAETAVNAAKSTASSAKSTYDSAMTSLKSISPNSYNTRAEFESAKNTAIGLGKTALLGYASGIVGVNAAAAAIGILSATDMDALSVLREAAENGLLGLIPGAPATLPTIIAAQLAEDALQC